MSFVCVCSSSEDDGSNDEDTEDELRGIQSPDEISDNDVERYDGSLSAETNIASSEAEPKCNSETSS